MMKITKAERRIHELGGIAKSCPYCIDRARHKVTPICSHCDSTGLISLIDYERYFSEKYNRPIDLNQCRIPELIKQNHSSLDEDDFYCPF